MSMTFYAATRDEDKCYGPVMPNFSDALDMAYGNAFGVMEALGIEHTDSSVTLDINDFIAICAEYILISAENMSVDRNDYTDKRVLQLLNIALRGRKAGATHIVGA